MVQKKFKLEFSAGGVLYRIEQKKIYVMLIKTNNSSIISLPKGNIERKEKPEQAAVREVFEETGCYGEIVDFLGKIDYWYHHQGFMIHKFVYYYLMKYAEGNPENHDDEVDEALWEEIDLAIERVSFANEREILIKARERIIDRDSRKLGEVNKNLKR
jgi:8-oxo-dGTP diphosphatase